jgi:glycine dehydrogenase
MTKLTSTDSFVSRHIGPRTTDISHMLTTMNSESIDRLIEQTIPAEIRRHDPLGIGDSISETDLQNELRRIAGLNTVAKTYIGMGYYGTITPPVILRNVMENPGWYTAYTPYQAEIAQGRLEALFNFQTVITDLTGLPVANASLLDEGTAAAEAMTLLYRAKQGGANRFFISEDVFPQTLDIVQLRAEPLGIAVEVGDISKFVPSPDYFGVLVQYPNGVGNVVSYADLVARSHAVGVKVAVGADLMALVLLTPPGQWGADIVFGSSQRFGVPLGYGGPHAAYFATQDEYKRQIPGRIIGLSVDRLGNPAYRMALQTREQHIRREKATSNICTAQALLAIMASFYAVYHGGEGLRRIATRIHQLAVNLATRVAPLGCLNQNAYFFDTVAISVTSADEVVAAALDQGFNLRRINSTTVGISIDETHGPTDIDALVAVFAAYAQRPVVGAGNEYPIQLPPHLLRTDSLLEYPVFQNTRSETQMMRYIRRLESRDLSLNTAMIPLGSCTMKLNAAVEMMAVTWPEFSQIHPFAPASQARGYHEVFAFLEDALCKATGFAATSLQPNSGAQGEYAGLMAIRAYHADRGDSHRNVALIPASAHGTNPASAALAGLEIVIVKCDARGNIDVADLREKIETYQAVLSVLMVTYPSTHGVFEAAIKEICQMIHDAGGQVYMDGANMNAQVGLTAPGLIGADVCHINLHKTFAIPHGGGGPGMGPICVAAHLAPFLPQHSIVDLGHAKGTRAVSSAPWGSASVLLISYAYIRLLGDAGLRYSTEMAIVNANYIKARLEPHYDVVYVGDQGRVAHELILNFQSFKKLAKIEVDDVAKRLMDYGFHAPTMSFPVPGTMMIEPTESEGLDELDRFCDAMIQIRQEIQWIIDGVADSNDNVLKNAPHTAPEAISSNWGHLYSREDAIYPKGTNPITKFWPAVARIDGAHGDRNLVCSCPSIHEYETVGG